MKQVQPDVWETATEHPFPGLNTHAYLLTREDGNILFYNTGHLHEIEKFEQLGGLARQYLSHEDELGNTLAACVCSRLYSRTWYLVTLLQVSIAMKKSPITTGRKRLSRHWTAC